MLTIAACVLFVLVVSVDWVTPFDRIAERFLDRVYGPHGPRE